MAERVTSCNYFLSQTHRSISAAICDYLMAEIPDPRNTTGTQRLSLSFCTIRIHNTSYQALLSFTSILQLHLNSHPLSGRTSLSIPPVETSTSQQPTSVISRHYRRSTSTDHSPLTGSLSFLKLTDASDDLSTTQTNMQRGNGRGRGTPAP